MSASGPRSCATSKQAAGNGSEPRMTQATGTSLSALSSDMCMPIDSLGRWRMDPCHRSSRLTISAESPLAYARPTWNQSLRAKIYVGAMHLPRVRRNVSMGTPSQRVFLAQFVNGGGPWSRHNANESEGSAGIAASLPQKVDQCVPGTWPNMRPRSRQGMFLGLSPLGFGPRTVREGMSTRQRTQRFRYTREVGK